jgi:hypothetical protein
MSLLIDSPGACLAKTAVLTRLYGDSAGVFERRGQKASRAFLKAALTKFGITPPPRVSIANDEL